MLAELKFVWYKTLTSRNVPFYSTQMFVDCTNQHGTNRKLKLFTFLEGSALPKHYFTAWPLRIINALFFSFAGRGKVNNRL